MKEKDIEAMTRKELMVELLTSRLRIRALSNRLALNDLTQRELEDEIKKLAKDLKEACEEENI